MKTKIVLLAVCAWVYTPTVSHAQNASSEPGEAATSDSQRKGVLTKAPHLKKRVPAVYPSHLFAAGVTGDVILLLTIAANGKVAHVEVSESSGRTELDASALDAVRAYEFEPAEIDGKPASVQLKYRHRFSIESVSQPKKAPVVSKSTEAPKPAGQLAGILYEKGTRMPLVGLTVRLVGLNLEAMSDARGQFVFQNVPAGPVSIAVDGESYEDIRDEETIRVGERTTVSYYLERNELDDRAMTIIGRRVKKEVARRVISVEEIRKIPGTSGDALKVVQNLPGVARVPFGGGGGVVIRGSNPGDSANMVQRHFIPLVFHFGGLRAVIPNELIETISFYPGNFSAEFGRFGGGVVDVRLRRPRGDRVGGRVEADIFDAGVFVEGPAHQGATFAVGGRRSYIDAVLPAVVGPDVDLAIAPRYYDYQAVYDFKSGAHRLRLSFFGSDDAFEAILKAPVEEEPSVRGGLRNQTHFNRGYAEWTWKLNDALTHQVSAAVGYNSVFLGIGPDLFLDNQATVYTLRDDVVVKLGDLGQWRMGLDTEFVPARIRISLPLPPKEGDSRSQSLSSRELVAIDKEISLFNPAAWTEFELRLFDQRLVMVPGFRAEYDAKIKDYAMDPRLAIRYAVVKDSTIVKGGIGLYAQRPSPDESDESFGDPSIGFERALHSSIGVEQKLGKRLEIDVIGFYKSLYDVVTPQVDESGNTNLEGEPERQLTNDGAGRVYGLEVLLRHPSTTRFFGWLSYTLMRAERKDLKTGRYRLFDFDQTHILTLVGQLKLNTRWELGARFRYVTGRPYTPIIGSVYNVDANTYEGIPGQTNSRRGPSFHSLDVRIDRNWIFETWILTAYLELRNAYNRQNVEFIDYNYDFSQPRNGTGLPIIPSLGIRGEF